MDKCGLPFMDVVKNRATQTAMTTEAIVRTGREQATRRASRGKGKLLEYFCLLLRAPLINRRGYRMDRHRCRLSCRWRWLFYAVE